MRSGSGNTADAGTTTRSAGRAVRQHAGHPRTRLDPGDPLGRGDDGAGEVDAEGERRLGPHLVPPLAEQQVGERDPDGVHVDQHVTRPGLGLRDVDQPDAGGTAGLDHLHGSHGRHLAA